MHQQDHQDLALRPGSRMMMRFIGEAQLAVGVDISNALQSHIGRHMPFERVIFLLVIMRSSSRFRMYSTGVASPVAEVAEGISINAMASSLDRSFETVRRHVNALISEGICERTPHGVVVRSSALETPIFAAMLRLLHDRMVGIIDDLKRGGVPMPPAYPERPYSHDATIAAVIDLTLSTWEFFGARYRDWLELLVVNTVVLAGARHIMLDPVLSRQYADAGTVLPEDQREVISVAALARTLRMTESTVRRKVQAAIEAGNLMRVGRNGIRATTPYLRSDSITRGSSLVAGRLVTVVQRLSPGGFLFEDPARCYLDGKPPPLCYL